MSAHAVAGRLTTPTGRLVLPASAPRDHWLAARRDGITATDLPKIMGLSQYGTLIDVYLDKTSEFPAGGETSEAAMWGIDLEDVVAQRWAERHNMKIRRVGLLARDGDQWCMASLDRLVSPGCNRSGMCGLEIKTRNQWALADWRTGAPEDVQTQCQWQMWVSGLDHVHVAALIGGQILVDHVVGRDEARIGELVAAASRLWVSVQANEFPPFDPATWTVDMADAAYPDRTGAVEVNPNVTDLLDAYRLATVDEATAKQVKDAAREALILALGDGDTALIDGREVYSYRPQTRTSVDAKALATDYPDAYQATARTVSTRTFRLSRGADST